MFRPLGDSFPEGSQEARNTSHPATEDYHPDTAPEARNTSHPATEDYHPDTAPEDPQSADRSAPPAP